MPIPGPSRGKTILNVIKCRVCGTRRGCSVEASENVISCSSSCGRKCNGNGKDDFEVFDGGTIICDGCQMKALKKPETVKLVPGIEF